MARPAPERLVFFFAGITGSGKTQALRARIRNRFPRRIYLDPRDDYEEGEDCEFATDSFDEMESYLDDWRIEDGGPFSVCLKPRGIETNVALDRISRLAWDLTNVLVVVDEGHTACPPPPSRDCPTSFLELLRMGRKRRISVAVLTPRPSQVHTDIRTEALGGETYYFKLTRADDLKDAAIIGGGNEFAALVARQPKLHGYRVDENGIQGVRVTFVRATNDQGQVIMYPELTNLEWYRRFDAPESA